MKYICVILFFLSAPGFWISMASMFKKETKLELLTDVSMLLMVKKGIRGGICHARHIGMQK